MLNTGEVTKRTLKLAWIVVLLAILEAFVKRGTFFIFIDKFQASCNTYNNTIMKNNGVDLSNHRDNVFPNFYSMYAVFP